MAVSEVINMDKLKDNDNRKYVCDDCINNCKKKATGCSEWKKNTLENKYERILYMGVGRSGLTDEDSIIVKAIRKQVALQPIVRGLGQRYCPACKCGVANDLYCSKCGQKLSN